MQQGITPDEDGGIEYVCGSEKRLYGSDACYKGVLPNQKASIAEQTRQNEYFSP